MMFQECEFCSAKDKILLQKKTRYIMNFPNKVSEIYNQAAERKYKRRGVSKIKKAKSCKRSL